jgi:hypothetical protein
VGVASPWKPRAAARLVEIEEAADLADEPAVVEAQNREPCHDNK